MGLNGNRGTGHNGGNRQTKLERDRLHRARLEWLRQYQNLALLPAAVGDITGSDRDLLEAVRLRMVNCSLYAASNNHIANRWGIRLLVSELRGLPVDKRQRWRS